MYEYRGVYVKIGMDKRKALLNVTVSVGFKILIMGIVIFARRILIDTCGNELNGLNALYISIIGILSVAELGVGSAITFCMYKPIVEGNNHQVSALYHLFRRIYLGIGMIVLVSGLLLTPFLKYFAKDYALLDVNLHVTFLLMLVSVAISYFFGAKTALINAYKNDYITNAIASGGLLLEHTLQIVVLLSTGSFVWYLVCKIISIFLQWLLTSWIAHRKFHSIISDRQRVDQETKKTLIRSIKAMFMHKVGSLLVNSADSAIISIFIGVIVLGEYSNYVTIQSSMANVIVLIFSSLTSVFGHVYASQSKEITRKYSEMFHLLNFIVGAVFYLGYYAVIDNLIALLFSPELIVSKSISFVITLNGFVQFMRKSTLTFRDATGAFYNDRWKPLAEGIMNIVLSVLLVQKIGVTGVIAATIITNLLLCHVIEPYVLYKNSFCASPKKYYFKNYAMIALFVVQLLCLDQIMVCRHTQWEELLINGSISVLISVIGCALIVLSDKETRDFAKETFRK